MKHIIVVSIDAMVCEDLEYAKTLPAFSEIMKDASVIERVRTIYPSVTHPVHATLITGASAGIHGIINNYKFEKDAPASGEWHNCLGDIRCDTLLHAAKRAGLTTATATWPLTCRGSEVIDYLVPGLMNYYLDGREGEPLSVFREYGATPCIMDIIAEGVQKFGARDVHPAVDAFQFFCATKIFERYQPNLMLIHPGHVDHTRHGYGVFSEQVKEALRLTDGWLCQLIECVKRTGLWDKTDIILLSDHGQINITRAISPNVYFAREGLISLDEEGKILSFDAYAKSAGASAQVFLSRPDDEELCNRVGRLLYHLRDEGVYGISEVFDKDEARERYSLFGDFSFVIETDGYTSFAENALMPAVRGFDLSDYRYGRATHGHLPSLGPCPTFIARGPSFKSGVRLPEGNILNHAPTVASILGITLNDAEGTPVKEILK